jgi:hypothetical protein
MKIKIDEQGRIFECALHFALLDGEQLVAASFAGRQSAVYAISANILMGKRTLILDQDDKIIKVTYSSGAYSGKKS